MMTGFLLRQWEWPPLRNIKTDYLDSMHFCTLRQIAGVGCGASSGAHKFRGKPFGAIVGHAVCVKNQILKIWT